MKNKKIKKSNIVVIAVLTFFFIFMTYLGFNTEDIKQMILGEDILGNLTQNTSVTKSNDEIEENSDNLKVYFIDQTTPNMIQRISEIFERNHLIYGDV